MPRSQEEALAELREKLERLPHCPKPNMAEIIRLGLEAGWPGEIRVETNQRVSSGNVTESLLALSMGTPSFRIVAGDEGVVEGITLLGPIVYHLGPWVELVKAIKAWHANYHIVWTEPPAPDDA